jgi:hypothetical protein
MQQHNHWFHVNDSLSQAFVQRDNRHDGERHLEVRVGNVETPGGGRQVFGAVGQSDTDITLLIGRNLNEVDRNGR